MPQVGRSAEEGSRASNHQGHVPRGSAPPVPHWWGLNTTNGVIGRPSLATAEKGKALLDAFVGLAASHLNVLSTPPNGGSED